MEQLQEGLGEHGVGVHVADAGQREAAPRADPLAGCLGVPFRRLERGEERLFRGRRIGAGQFLDGLLARRLVAGGGDFGRARGEELLLLQLDALPRRVAQHHVEAAAAHDFGEGRAPMKEAAPVRRLAQRGGAAGPRGQALVEAVEVFGERRGLHCGARFLGEKRPGEEVGALLLLRQCRVPPRGFPGGSFTLDVAERFLGHVLEAGERGGVLRRGLVEHAVLHGAARLPVAFPERQADGLVVAGQRRVGLVGDALGHDRGVEHADQAVALADVRVEEGQRLARLDRFHPQRRAAQIDRQRVAVHAVDAVLRDCAQGAAAGVVVGYAGVRFEFGEAGGHAPRRGQQEMPRAAGRIDDLEGEDCRPRVFALGGGALENGVERRADQFVDQRGRRVVRAGQLALGAAGLFAGAAGEVERPGFRVHCGAQVEQAFVNRAEFLGIHVAVVDAGKRPAGGQEGEAAHGCEQAIVGDGRVVEAGALGGAEQAAQGGQGERGRAGAVEDAEDDAQALPEVVGAAVVVPPAQGALAQAGKGIALRIDGARVLAGAGRVQQAAVFGGEQKEQAVHQGEQLAEVVRGREFARAQGVAQRLVAGMFEEAVAQAAQGVGDAVAQIGQGALAGLVSLAPPDFHDAAGGLAAAGRLQARGVGQEPQRGKVGVEFLLEDELEVGFDRGAPGEAGVVAQDAQLRAVGDDAPQAAVLSVEVLLHQAVGRLPPAFAAEARVGPVEIAAARRQQQRHGAAAGAVGQLEDAIIEGGASRRGQVGVAEDAAQQRVKPAAGAVALRVEVVADAPVAGDFVLERERPGEAVIGRRLPRRAQRGGFVEELRRQDAAFDPQRRESAAFARNGHIRLTTPPRAGKRKRRSCPRAGPPSRRSAGRRRGLPCGCVHGRREVPAPGARRWR